ncbi:hypothetical protein Tco_0494182 [Tanacetum coccineum]
MLEEYNYYITYRADQHLIIKISYKINKSTKHATMRIERNNQPLSLTVYEKFVLKMLGFSEWIKVHALASKNKSKANYLLLRNLKAKFKWLKTQARKLGILPPPELSAFGLSAAKKKRKRSSEIIKEVFLIRIQSAIQKGTLEAEELFKKMELAIEARNDASQARLIVKDNLDGLSQHMLGIEDPLSTRLRGIKDSLSAKHQRAVKDSLSVKPQRATSDIFESKTSSRKSKIT